MREWTKTEMELLASQTDKPAAVFVYTPLCGTCKLAERMLTVVQEALPGLTLYRANLNLLPELAEMWRVTSVPALLILERGAVAERHYALRSVDFLYHVLMRFA
ncbi:thioredoxin family protein [Brevibacillus thermoruber]|uniref:thioredoxin family protein n=1 Tax=Brevibacillus thermoruber TaxID=33942 RepID=UPI00041FE3A5|nr:thioredoxin family protein [Brevibacillus thermoruber]